jgi:hypothetical protein
MRKEICVHSFCRRPLGRHGCRWEDNIIMDLKEIGWEDATWIHLAQYRDHWQAVVNMTKFWEFPEWLSRRTQLHGVSFT